MSETDGKTPEKSSGATSTKPPAKVKKQWKNPALRMMGIPRFSLPSRNWMIFWTVLTATGGGILYDKNEQKNIRAKWMDEVKQLSTEAYATDRKPRKLTIYIAPPPNDFLDESVKLFRKYIKPVLNSSAMDYEIFSETRQGDIRATVAEKIRALRRAKLAEVEAQRLEAEARQYARSWTRLFKSVLSFGFGSKQPESDVLTPRHQLYDAKDVLGLYQVVDTVEPKCDDETDQLPGGVICVGRGAYKEYMTGLHEGLLGPLEKPQSVLDEEQRIKDDKQKQKEQDEQDGKAVRDDDDEEEKREPVTKPYILPEAYASASLAPELDFSSTITENNIPVVFEQPLYVFAVPNLLGFLKTPQKIYRYYTRRRLAEDYGFRATAVVYNKVRPFREKDVYQAKEEELDWPKKWVETGKERNSEWVQEMVVDPRITSRMKVYDPELN